MKSKSMIFFVVVFMFCVGCNMTPQQRCMILKTTTSMGVKFALGKWGDKFGIAEQNKAVEILENHVLPVVKGERGIVTREQMDKALLMLDNNIKNDDIKNAIQSGINSAMVLVDPIPRKGKVVGEILNVLKCIFLGVLDAFQSSATTPTIRAKAVKPKKAKLYWYEK